MQNAAVCWERAKQYLLPKPTPTDKLQDATSIPFLLNSWLPADKNWFFQKNFFRDVECHVFCYRRSNLNALEKLRCDLLCLNQPCGLLKIIPSTQQIQHDHCYCSFSGEQREITVSSSDVSSLLIQPQDKTITSEDILQTLSLSPNKRNRKLENNLTVWSGMKNVAFELLAWSVVVSSYKYKEHRHYYLPKTHA